MTNDEMKLISAAQSVAGSDSGQLLLKHLSWYCFENRSTYVEENHDKQNVNNGKRAVILHLRALISTDLTKPQPEPVKDENYVSFKE
jgi:hypothetical protein